MRRSQQNQAPVIPNDRLEHDRIMLETNLRHSEAAIHLSESDADDLESLEYPRHNSGHVSLGELPSLDHRVRDYLADEDTPGQGWSYRTVDDDEEGIHPYGGESLSTLAHHASAVTLGAGLGGRGARRDASMSGAEYDPDRPIHDIIAGVTGKLNVFDTKRQTDEMDNQDSTELDHILETGAQPRSHRAASPITSGSSSHSDLDQPTPKGRPKLSDALRSVSLSPRRPRSPRVIHPASPLPQANRHHVATPHPTQRHPQPPKPVPKVVPNPPPPSSASASSKGSKFTRMAKGIAQEIQYEKGQLNTPMPYSKNTNAPVATNPTRTSAKVQLPDVTGLTNAIESPAKAAAEYYAYRTETKLRETETRLLHTLNNVQERIQQLEEENGISRRRVRELEMELEDCKREVVRERTRLIEQEELLKQRMKRTSKGKERARTDDSSHFHERYKEAVEEKKALEALITSLRTHLTRLTSELSSYREFLAELRILRNEDSATLHEKGVEIAYLKSEVERLAGEIEVLRGVVEEGLRERRAAKEASLQTAHQDEIGHHDLTEEEEEIEAEPEDADVLYANAHAKKRTVRTDWATKGSPNNHNITRFMDSIDYERISAEIEERRSNHSGSIDISQLPPAQSPAQTPSPKPRRSNRTMSDSDESAARLEASMLGRKAPSPGPISDPEEADAFGPPRPREPGPSTRSRTIHVPEEGHDHELHAKRRRRVSTDVVDEVPFPKIRGQRLERLFFSVPEHDVRTCPTCNGRGRRGLEEPPVTSAWMNRRTSGTRSRHGSDEDEGFVEGSQTHDRHRNQRSPRDQGHVRSGSGGKRRERSLQDINEVPSVAKQEGLPPQTIVARIIRELEDDFTHYKSIYVELADEYKQMDAASNVAQRNTLAKHLREVVDILEQKGDQIASLYDQLSFKNKSAGGRDIGAKAR